MFAVPAMICNHDVCCNVFITVISVIILFHKEVLTQKVTEHKGTMVTDSLKLVIAISRHGNRGGYSDYPLDPYPLNNTNFWPYGRLQLTPFGRIQAHNLGKKLRTMYDGFLSDTFRSEDIFASCDLVERIVMTGELVLAGLYPPVGFQRWSNTIDWQPIAIYSNDTDHSELLASCPRYIEEKNKTLNDVLIKEAPTITYLSRAVYQHTGENLSALDLDTMFDKLISEETEGYKLPKWLTNIYPEPLQDLSSKIFKSYYAGNDEIVRLSVGNLCEEMVANMKRKASGSLLPDRKLFYYSGHDNTILGLEAALGVQPPSLTKVVHVGSALIVELHQTPHTDEFFVQLWYIDGSSLDLSPAKLPLPLCGEPCTLQNLQNFSSKFFGVDFERECQTASNQR